MQNKHRNTNKRITITYRTYIRKYHFNKDLILIWNHNTIIEIHFILKVSPFPRMKWKQKCMTGLSDPLTEHLFVICGCFSIHLCTTQDEQFAFHALHRHKLTYMMQEVLSTDVTPERIAIFLLIIKRTFVVSLRLNSFYFNVGFRFDFTLLEPIYRNSYMFCHVLTHLVFV